MTYVSNSDFARVFGDEGTGVYIAPEGTPFATDLSPLDAPNEPIGWIDGKIDLEIDKEVKKFYGQAGKLIRTKVSRADFTVKFTALEDSALVQELVFADQPVTVTGTGETAIATQQIGKNQTRTVRRVVHLDSFDGDIQDRYPCLAELIYKGTVKIADNEELRGYEFELSVIDGQISRISNSPGLLA